MTKTDEPAATTTEPVTITANVIEAYMVDSLEFWCQNCKCRHTKTVRRLPARTLKFELLSSLSFNCNCGAEFIVKY
ncbi:hypothetical protein A3E39_00725 [Candidatus Uhrbacteria bacterium RIFCSPHIGHO2_12_FULL_60_25]|uniref:Uncharacterized protein n=1 Tax=Candidatus Uhrbacteria bacterium RIFCSPHIGHO2_12_FULL_60_25 TaxID=1802399 RepID=A0A1F7UMZ0_9BACT|nr:MAG: hypothetical protein A3D73_04255 [Candidatus Uhrbacteria bacterium RIFCSPHIGHO2_02_FULL_60_44]OGL79632.1 MAG: hypothetical protein A3E39_00725 [Candidatus Uhrbacteria bacterium RIFCSPHIGHO2_12_FULL_60_25]